MNDDVRIGTTIGAKYRIDALIGQGGLGRVYRGTHLALGSTVAIKFVLASPAHVDEVRERFRREGTVLAALRHPGIVAAHDFGYDDGEPYLVMEYVEGVPLGDAIMPGGVAMPFRRVASITQQIARVLEAAHAAKIVHRDLKPDNVMLVDIGGADHVKVLDFGIALMLADTGPRLTATNAFQGTPMYMSPEQWRGRDVGPATDVYALGAVLYEMLAGEPPFDGESPADVMAKHMFVPPPPALDRGVGRAVPPDLEHLALRALAKKVEERPAIGEMLETLEQWTRGTSVLALAQHSTEERIRTVALSRRERGLPPLPTTIGELQVPSTQAGQTDQAAVDSTRAMPVEGAPSVRLWGFDEERTDALVAALAMNGVTARAWRKPTAPSGDDLAKTKAIVVRFEEGIATALLALRAVSKVPVLVVDVKSAADTAPLVRAGASDIALASIGDDALATKVVRLIRRGR